MNRARSSSSLGPVFSDLLTATAITNLGDGIRLATLPLLATTLTESPLAIAGVTAAQFLPWLVFAPIGGVIVDHADRRRLTLRTQIWRAGVMIGLAAAVLADAASMWMLFATAFIITVGEILVDPSVVATVPTIVDKPDLDHANGQISSVEIVTNEVIGAPVGAGLFLAAPWIPFAIDGLSYLTSTVPFRRLPDQPRREAHPSGLKEVLAEAPAGLRFILRHPMLRPWTLAVAVFNIGAAAGFSLLVLLVLDTLDSSEVVYAILLTGAAIAAAGASTVAPGLVGRFGRPPVLLAATAIAAVTLLGLGRATSIVAAAALWAVNGAVTAVLLAIGRGYIQRYCPNELLGRAAVASRTIARTAFVVGALAGGAIAGGTSVASTFVLAGVVQLVSLVPMALAFRHDDA